MIQLNPADMPIFINWKRFEIDYSKINSLEDVIMIIKAMNIHISCDAAIPERYKEMYDKGFLIEIK